MTRGCLILFATALTGCAGTLSSEQFPTPEALLAASKAAFRRGEYTKAQSGFQRVTFELPPHDPAIVEARFFTAECEFADGDYVTASRDFRKVADDFPDNPLAPDALLRSADATAELWRRPELDPTYGEAAIATYAELQGRYPGTPAAERGKTRSAVVMDRLALKDLQTGEFYFRLRAYDPAILYFKEVFRRYTQSRYAPDALVRLVDSYRRIGYDDEARQACDYLRQNFPRAEGLATACPGAAPTPTKR
jgi:outer membrane protein assembly factor BamD